MLHRYSLLLLLLLQLLLQLGTVLGDIVFQEVTHPGLNYESIGNRIGLLGSFNALSFYSFVNSSSFLQQQPSNGTTTQTRNSKRDDDDAPTNSTITNGLFIQDMSTNYNKRIADLNGDIYQLYALTNSTVIINGNFTILNNQSVVPPIVYNITSEKITPIFKEKPTGSVKTLYVDNELIYLGGDFLFENSTGTAIYNYVNNTLYSTPFQGFGKDATVNSIIKVSDGTNDKSDKGSIIFGGKFNTLGLSDLLVHNITGNSTNDTSITTAEQVVSLKESDFTSVNGDPSNDDSSLICPALNPVWAALPASGAEWTVQLPNEKSGTYPTKIRIYIPDSTDGTKTFRLYTLPNNGIMNLTYIDPMTNKVAFCDASCPLLSFSDLKGATESNKQNSDSLNEDDVFVDEEDGTYVAYYDPSTKTKTLGYGSNFQEFSLVNHIAIDAARITVIDWYGERALLGGFELYLNSITVFGDNRLNQPNCNLDLDTEFANYARIDSGNFQSIREINPSGNIPRGYLVAQDTNAKITLFPNISHSGNYSLRFFTPGCVADQSCQQRSIVNVSVIDNQNRILETSMISQNNNDDKYDPIYDGFIEGKENGDGKARIEVSFERAINEAVGSSWIVIDKVMAIVTSLDSYSQSNLTSRRRRGLSYMELNGLFEYSLANFTHFDELLVHYKSGDKTIINVNNTFVGNSTINILSGLLSNETSIEQITTHQESLLLLGNLQSSSKNLTLSNNNLIQLNVDSYGSNQTRIDLPNELKKRDTQTIFGVTFNNSISTMVSLDQGVLMMGEFSMQSDNIENLSTGRSTNNANNFVLYSQDKWKGFGNEFTKHDFVNFANVTVDKVEYYIFSTAGGDTFRIWDNSNSKWVQETSRQLNITQGIKISDTQQILGGPAFNIMDFYSIDQAFVADSEFDQFGIDIPEKEDGFSISSSFYVNESISVVGGKFETENSSTINIGFINNTSPNRAIIPLNGEINWGQNTTIQSLYVDRNYDYLFIGVNGQVELATTNVTGLVIYDLKNNTFASFQPAALSTDNDDPIQINSLVFYDEGNSLLVGGRFDNAGSLECPSLCIYDISNTRWMSPQAQAEKSVVRVNGTVADIRFYQSNRVLIGGESLSIDNNQYDFITYDFDAGTFDTKDSLNSLSGPINRFVLNDLSNNDLNGRMVAYGSNFVSGFDGKEWKRIDDGIDFSQVSQFSDLKLFPVNSTRSGNDQYFDRNQVLALAGMFTLKDYGVVNIALYNGTHWIPYIFTSISGDGNFVGEVKSILIDDNYRFQSSRDLSNLDRFLSVGKVVGISLACAVGSTALLGLLFIIPYFAIFRRKNNRDYSVASKRIQEQEMMQTIKPEDLLHEIDLQRHH